MHTLFCVDFISLVCSEVEFLGSLQNINAQQDMQFQMLSERLRNAVAPRVLGVSQPFRVQQSNQQQPPSPAHYIHQGPTQVPTGGSYIAPAVRQYAQ